MRMQIYDALGGGLRAASNAPTNQCDQRSPNLGVPNGGPGGDAGCTLPPGDFAAAVTWAECPCGAACLKPYFDHNKERTPYGTVQMYTPPASRRYFPGVPSAKHWENGITTNIFTFDVQLTNNYGHDLTNVSIVLSDITPAEGRQGFEDARPHACLNNNFAIWSFGDLPAGATVTRTVKLYLPNDAGFTITGYLVSLSGAGCTANLEDSDGDGLTNAVEAQLGTKPTDPDTDGDGLFDGAETGTGIYLGWWNTGTDPLLRDTDGDCFGDGTEIAENFDPLDPTDHPDRKCSQADLKNKVP
jgi:hypothetical protein